MTRARKISTLITMLTASALTCLLPMTLVAQESGTASVSSLTSPKHKILLVSVPNIVTKKVEEETADGEAGGVTDIAPIAPGSTIAFIDFEHVIPSSFLIDRAYCVPLVSSAIAQHLADLNLYKVVTRDHIASVIEEQNFSNSGSVDSATAAKLGKLIGAEVLVYGKVQLCTASQNNLTDMGILGRLIPGAGETNFRPIEKLANAASRITNRGRNKKEEMEEVGSNIDNALFDTKKSNDRSLIIAQIELIEASTGKQIFSTRLEGEFRYSSDDSRPPMESQELYANAANILANNFIDIFLARRKEKFIHLYTDPQYEFDKGAALIQLGDCPAALTHYQIIYNRYQNRMSEKDLARLMYNHGIAAMCSNQLPTALDRLWASLRLSLDPMAFDAIEFTNDMIDHGRSVLSENDPIIQAARERNFDLFR